MNRIETLKKLDEAADLLEQAAAELYTLGCSYNMTTRIQTVIDMINRLHDDAGWCDLPEETE